MTNEEFFKAIQKTPPYHYYAAPADELGVVYHDLYPIEPMMVKDKAWTPEESFKHRWS
jgi:hypothetical protein